MTGTENHYEKAWRDMLEAANADDYERADAHARYLLDWIGRGGAVPDSGVNAPDPLNAFIVRAACRWVVDFQSEGRR